MDPGRQCRGIIERERLEEDAESPSDGLDPQPLEEVIEQAVEEAAVEAIPEVAAEAAEEAVAEQIEGL